MKKKLYCKIFTRLFCLLIVICVFARTVHASDADLRAAAQNPVADMISLPFQNNTIFGVGPNDKVVNALNIQPVAPFKLNEEWNVITRTIVPLIYVPDSIAGLDILPEGVGRDSNFGLSDINFSSYFSPRDPSSFIWGVGPSITFPTASDKLLGAEKWSAGPAAVVLKQSNKWTIGTLVRQLWSFAGKDSRADVSQLLVQPFVNYNLNDGWYIVSAPIITANFKKTSTERWVVPVGIGLGKIFSIGKQPINAQLSYYYNIETPTNGGESSIRLQIQFLFPKQK